MDEVSDRIDRVLDFVGRATQLKDTLRSGRTGNGARESVAAHSWGLSLLVLLLEGDLDRIDLAQLLRLCILHDLGEAISGDIPAIHQDSAEDKSARERADLLTLTEGLPEDVAARLVALWDEYDAGATPEAVLAKGLDKIETMLQHVNGRQDPGFDYLWNLGYAVDRTARTPLLRALRERVDHRTRERAAQPRALPDLQLAGPVPELPVKDLEAARAWYRDRLGFEFGWTHAEGKIGAVSHGNCALFLRETPGEVAPSAVWIFAHDVERAFATAKRLGAEIVAPLATKPWGLRQFTLRDRDGHLVHIHHDM